ncbi:hypothetical protein V6N13_108051 [Hibiscus sabdariffa]
MSLVLERTKEAIDSSKALKKLLNYIEMSDKLNQLHLGISVPPHHSSHGLASFLQFLVEFKGLSVESID